MDQSNLQTDTERRCLDYGRRIVRSTTELFGQPVVLVPIYPRSKRPRFRRFQTFTLDLMQDDQFVACIGRPNCNVAVLLGKASRGLCTFDFDDDQKPLNVFGEQRTVPPDAHDNWPPWTEPVVFRRRRVPAKLRLQR